MVFKDDINKRIEHYFGEKSTIALTKLTDAICQTEYLKTDRIIRYILFLSKGNLNALDRFIDVAKNDTRDVMLWAEYENLDNDFKYKRIRDFNKTFEECSDNVKE